MPPIRTSIVAGKALGLERIEELRVTGAVVHLRDISQDQVGRFLARIGGNAALVEFVDIYPTLCELTGVPVPDDLEGTSFAPLVDDPSRPWKKAAFTQFLREGIWIAPDGVEYMGYSVRTDRFRYTEWVDWETFELKATELYDHERDPGESRNVAEDAGYADVRSETATILEAGWRAARPE